MGKILLDIYHYNNNNWEKLGRGNSFHSFSYLQTFNCPHHLTGFLNKTNSVQHLPEQQQLFVREDETGWEGEVASCEPSSPLLRISAQVIKLSSCGGSTLPSTSTSMSPSPSPATSSSSCRLAEDLHHHPPSSKHSILVIYDIYIPYMVFLMPLSSTCRLAEDIHHHLHIQ